MRRLQRSWSKVQRVCAYRVPMDLRVASQSLLQEKLSTIDAPCLEWLALFLETAIKEVDQLQRDLLEA